MKNNITRFGPFLGAIYFAMLAEQKYSAGEMTKFYILATICIATLSIAFISLYRRRS